MPSTPSAYPQVVSRTFASLRVLQLYVSAGHSHFGAGSIPGSSTEHVLFKGFFSPGLLPLWAHFGCGHILGTS
jgi:hypothetical protein